MTSTTWQESALDELDADVCWRLLASRRTGRIGYADRDGPVVLPLTYATHGRTVWFRTTCSGPLEVRLPGQLVAFQIDHVDQREQSGWSVLLRGRARHVIDAEIGGEVGGAHLAGPTPWPTDGHTRLFRIDATGVSGRALQPA